jgi:glycosyltransferase involved in cell wall biosynthesis
MKILAVEPYYGLSHRSFLEGYKKFSRHEVEIWSLPPRKWKWRMRGSAYHFAQESWRLYPEGGPDALLASDFLNLPDFIALAPRAFARVPALAYFHENQITYPLGQHAPIDYHYGWINLSSAMAADRVLFNSLHHRDGFLRGARDVFHRMPDYVPEALLERMEERCGVLPIGMDLEHLDAIRRSCPREPRQAPVILWNHRWEYDKGPETFFHALRILKTQGASFRIVVCGQTFKTHPKVFDSAREWFSDRIDHFGYFKDADAYFRRAAQCDIVLSTAIHEFFGVSIVEAAYLGCLPVLPRRLSYPEIVPPHLHPLFLYERDGDLVEFLGRFLARPPIEYLEELRAALDRYHWRRIAAELDREFETLVESRPSGR